MSDGRKDKDDKKKDKGPEDLHSPTPASSNEKFTEWLIGLFTDEQMPMYIEVVPLSGPNLQKAGKAIQRYDHRDRKKPLTAEACVEISNRFIAHAQLDCDVAGRACKYGVIAWDTLRSADPITKFPLKMTPKNSDGPQEDTTEDGFGSDRLLRRQDAIYDDDRWRVAQYQKAQGETLDMYQEENERLRNYVEKLMDKVMTMHERLEEALSRREDRDHERRKQEFWMREIADGTSFLKGIAPHIVHKLTGKQLPTDRSLWAMVIMNFLKSCTTEQKEVAFGVVNGERVKNGIFTEEQTGLFHLVAEGDLPDERLYDVLPDGKFEITHTQFGEITKCFKEQQLMPLQMLFQELMAKRMQQST